MPNSATPAANPRLSVIERRAGTTRDTIEETANIRGVPVVFIDTAGLREAHDELELEGIRRSRESLARAEFILHVLDASEPLTPADDQYLAEFAGKKRILVRNKADLPARWTARELEHQHRPRRDQPEGEVEQPTQSLPSPALALPLSEQEEKPVPGNLVRISHRAGWELSAPMIDISCTTGQGMEALKDAIKSLVWSGQIQSEMLQVMINSRHENALRRGHEATLHALNAFRADEPLELVAGELHIAVNAIGEIVGKTTTEDLLDVIFKQFCIGK